MRISALFPNKKSLSFYYLAALVVAIPIGVSSQGKSVKNIREIYALADGGYVLFGQELKHFPGPSYSGYNAWALRVTSDGTMLWEKILGDKYTYEPSPYGSGEDNPEDIWPTSDGGFVVTASSDGLRDPGSFDAWVVRLSRDGDVMWHKTKGGDEQEHLHTISQTSDGGFIAGGQSASIGRSDGYMCLWITRLDADGETLWEKAYTDFLYATDIKQTADGGFILTGASEKTTKCDVLVAKLDANGELEWSKIFASPAYDSPGDVFETEDGYLVSCKIGMSNPTTWLIKLNKNGDKVWEKKYKRADAPAGNGASYIFKADAGGYYLLEPIWIKALDKGGVWVLRLDGTGRKLWDKVCGTCEAQTIAENERLILASYSDEAGLTLRKIDLKPDMACAP